jgi:ABC-2 type transport system permease protein
LKRALHAEWTKVRTVPGTIWLLTAAIGVTVALSAASAVTVKCPAVGCNQDTIKLSLTGIALGQAIIVAVAVLAIGGEYSTGLIRISFAATPQRESVLAAKAAVVGGLVLAAGTIAVFGSLLAGRLVLPGNGFTTAHGHPLPSVLGAPVLRAAVGSVLYLTLIAALSLGVATAVRDTATAIGVVLGLLYFFPIAAQMVTDPQWQRRLEQLGPMTAGLAIQATTDIRSLPIGPWAGLGVLAAWASAALVAGGFLLQRRDA